MHRARQLQRKSAGISVLETIFVLGVLMMLGAVLLPLLSRSYTSAQLASAERTIADALREARSRSRGNFQYTTHGLFVNIISAPVMLTMYQGESYGVRSSEADYMIPLETDAVVSLEPSIPDVHFSGSVGTTTARKIFITTGGDTHTLTLTEAGLIYEE
ncbi:MAG: hypothetical protein AAB343_03270 [Patescibacteria group bacterium]